MHVLSGNREKGVLNRNVLLREVDNGGFVFVTERNSRKYADLVSDFSSIWPKQILSYFVIKTNSLLAETKSIDCSYVSMDIPRDSRYRLQTSEKTFFAMNNI